MIATIGLSAEGKRETIVCGKRSEHLIDKGLSGARLSTATTETTERKEKKQDAQSVCPGLGLK